MEPNLPINEMIINNLSAVNGWAVWGASIVYFALGVIWYAPFLFGNLVKTEKPYPGDVPHSSYVIRGYIGEFLSSWLIAYVLALFIRGNQAVLIEDGVYVATWVWIGFLATTHFSYFLWGRKSFLSYFIHACFMLAGFVTMGAVIMAIGP